MSDTSKTLIPTTYLAGLQTTQASFDDFSVGLLRFSMDHTSNILRIPTDREPTILEWFSPKSYVYKVSKATTEDVRMAGLSPETPILEISPIEDRSILGSFGRMSNVGVNAPLRFSLTRTECLDLVHNKSSPVADCKILCEICDKTQEQSRIGELRYSILSISCMRF
jgi:hypothetical protein